MCFTNIDDIISFFLLALAGIPHYLAVEVLPKEVITTFN